MTDHIIKAAKAAGGTTYTNRHHDGTACAFGPEALERFYAIARAEALEDAATLAFNADHMGSVNLKLMKNRIGNAIRELKERP